MDGCPTIERNGLLTSLHSVKHEYHCIKEFYTPHKLFTDNLSGQMGPVEDSLLVSQTEMIQELSYQRHLLWNNWLNESGENSGVFQGSSKVYC
jgi:hypothetical protein